MTPEGHPPPEAGAARLPADVAQLATRLPGGVVVFDIDQRKGLFVNNHLMSLLGYGEEAYHDSHFFRGLVHPQDDAVVQGHITRVVELPDGDFDEVEYRMRRSDGQWRWVVSRSTPLVRDATGRVSHLLALTVDTSRRRAREENLRRRAAAERAQREWATLQFEVIAGVEAAGPDMHGRARALAEALVPRVADLAVLELDGLEIPVVAALPGREDLRWEAERLPDALRRLHGDLAPAAPEVAGRFTVTSQVPRAGTVEDDGGLLAWLDVRSHMSLTVDLGSARRGVLSLSRCSEGREEFGPADAAALRALTDRAEVLLAAAAVRDEEHRIAVRLQRALLPDDVVRSPAVDIAGRYVPAAGLLEVGGDWYDTWTAPGGAIGATVGDVVGHGLEPAAAMGRLRAVQTALGPRARGPAHLLDELDAYARAAGGPSFATAAALLLDPRDGTLRYSSAGHPPALVVHPDGTSRWLSGGRSLPLCAPRLTDDAATRPEARTRLTPGSLVVLYSDGLIERRGESISAGLDRLAAQAPALVGVDAAAACDELLARLRDGQGRDDVVVLCLRVVATGDDVP